MISRRLIGLSFLSCICHEDSGDDMSRDSLGLSLYEEDSSDDEAMMMHESSSTDPQREKHLQIDEPEPSMVRSFHIPTCLSLDSRGILSWRVVIVSSGDILPMSFVSSKNIMHPQNTLERSRKSSETTKKF